MRMLLTMSSEVAMKARTTLVAMGMEKSEFGHDLDPGIMGKGKGQG